jgi:extradiol dioxygenase family protein
VAKPLFHLAFPVHDLKAAKKFYRALGCEAGRVSEHSAIFKLGEHQIVAQLSAEKPRRQPGIYPRHFGLIFGSLKEWQALERRARRRKLTFYQAPKLRFPGTPLEHRTFFLEDPSFNLLEFKFYSHPAAIFGKSRMKKVGDR